MNPLFLDCLGVNSGHLGNTFYNSVSMSFSHIVSRWVYSKCSLALYMPTLDGNFITAGQCTSQHCHVIGCGRQCMYLVFISGAPYSWRCNNHLFIWAVQHMEVGSKHGFGSGDSTSCRCLQDISPHVHGTVTLIGGTSINTGTREGCAACQVLPMISSVVLL
jgi:hypothetical protein